MKRVLIALLLGFALFSSAIAQTAGTATDTKAVMKEFMRSSQIEGLVLNFVLLNSKTVDLLFQAPGKYALRARANQATIFYVQGTPEKDVKFDNVFQIEQDGRTLNCSVTNIKNFAPGNVAKGELINGLIQLDSKLELTHPFTIKGSSGTVEFKLDNAAIEMSK